MTLAPTRVRREWILTAIIAVIVLGVGARAPVFLTWRNALDTGNDSAILAILVMGQMMVLLTRGVDLSVASNLALTGMTDKLDLVLERTIDAPVSLVWEAYTNPEHLKQWFAPRPYEISEIDLDLRPGGIFRIRMTSQGTAARLRPYEDHREAQ